MTLFYLDTSALLPYYHLEVTSEKVQAFFETLDNPPLISVLTKVEFSSALARWVRMKELQTAEADKIQHKFEAHVSSRLYKIQEVSPATFVMAERWMIQRTGSLRTLDALHLATSIRMDATLVTCDKALADAADILFCDYLLISQRN